MLSLGCYNPPVVLAGASSESGEQTSMGASSAAGTEDDWSGSFGSTTMKATATTTADTVNTSASTGATATADEGESTDTTGSSDTSGDDESTAGQMCPPGEAHEEQRACGDCGSQRRGRLCSSDGTWPDWPDDAWSACIDEGVCTPGDTDQQVRACGSCGSQKRTLSCTSACAWDDDATWSTCESTPVCSPGQYFVDPVPTTCGSLCGNQYRRKPCLADGCDWGAWEDFGGCVDERDCSPRQVQMEQDSCGDCGTKSGTRTCLSTCTWPTSPTWGGCQGEGECKPGSEQWRTDVACGDCDGRETSKRTCRSDCSYPATWIVTKACALSECQSGNASQCNHALGVCECDATFPSCGTGQTCCGAPPGLKKANSCEITTQTACPLFLCGSGWYDCTAGWTCVDGFCEQNRAVSQRGVD